MHSWRRSAAYRIAFANFITFAAGLALLGLVVFGFFGYLVFRIAFDRKISTGLIALGVAIGYSSAMMYSLIPEDHISWSGHFFGFIGGFVAARMRYPYQPRIITAKMLESVIQFPNAPQSRPASRHH